MTTPPSTDDPVAWCRSRLLVPGHPLALTLPYAAADKRDALVALLTVIGEIASVPGDVSDEQVAQRKLGWWREALAEGLPHPAVQAWLRSGAAQHVPPAGFDQLIDAVAAEIVPPRFEQVEAMERHCRLIAGPGALLEAMLVHDGTEPDEDEARRLVRLAAAGYRIRITRDLALDARQERWLVPLELQAEYQLTRQHVAAGEGGRRLDALVRHMAGDAILAIDKQISEFSAPAAWRNRHFLLRVQLDRNIGGKLLRKPSRVVEERVTPGRMSDAFSVWRRARELRKAASAQSRSGSA
ncbi:MAG TPA: squalene/phytoene synthase family protein [Wenzhouxiangellaceae bacterium]|nr:squalene/phytoene synthase family protein [Wenzhouxiangellaceae bacterium]